VMDGFFDDFWMEFTRPENIVGHIAYVLLIASMLMRRMNWLRALAICSGLVAAYYYATLGDYVSMFWETIFTLVNLGQLIILQIENRRGTFSADEAFFIKHTLSGVERAHARRLVKLGAWTQVAERVPLIKEDQVPSKLKFLVSGRAEVTRKGDRIGEVSKGDFLGEMSYLNGGKASATAITLETTRYLAFDRAALRRHLVRYPEVRHALEAGFNRDLVAKLSRSVSTLGDVEREQG